MAEKDRGFFWGSNLVARVIFVLIAVYLAASIVVLLLAIGILPLPNPYRNPYILMIIALISFALTACVSIYHLSTMIRRRKRKDDFKAVSA
jgi:hypothetical protein